LLLEIKNRWIWTLVLAPFVTSNQKSVILNNKSLKRLENQSLSKLLSQNLSLALTDSPYYDT
jgi:hypothetical protein